MTAALAIGAAALLLACGGGDSNDNGSASAAGGGSGLVSIRSVDGTNVLADAEGRTLYNAEVEKGRIRCTGACTSFWDPLDASAKQRGRHPRIWTLTSAWSSAQTAPTS